MAIFRVSHAWFGASSCTALTGIPASPCSGEFGISSLGSERPFHPAPCDTQVQHKKSLLEGSLQSVGEMLLSKHFPLFSCRLSWKWRRRSWESREASMKYPFHGCLDKCAHITPWAHLPCSSWGSWGWVSGSPDKVLFVLMVWLEQHQSCPECFYSSADPLHEGDPAPEHPQPLSRAGTPLCRHQAPAEQDWGLSPAVPLPLVHMVPNHLSCPSVLTECLSPVSAELWAVPCQI